MMKNIGLFLDIDGVLTDYPVNMKIAECLGVEKELEVIEGDFACGLIDNVGFNKRYTPLFNKAGFSRNDAESYLDQVPLREGAEDLLSCNEPDVYLVTNGADYYAVPFALRYGVPDSHLTCTWMRYKEDKLDFLDPGRCIGKERFVADRTHRFDVSIGVGDIYENDASFLKHCDIAVLLEGSHPNCISVPNLPQVTNFVRGMRRLCR